MSLRTEFKKFIKNNPQSEASYATLPVSGIDVEWNDLYNAWKIDMGMDVNEFLERNPDIHENLIQRGVLKEDQKVSPRDLLKRGLIAPILDELVKATDIGERTAWVGHQLRHVGTGTLSGEAKNKLYIKAIESDTVGGGRHNWEVLPNGKGIVYNPLKDYNYKKFGGTREEYRKLGTQWRKTHKDFRGFTNKHGFFEEDGNVYRIRNKGGGRAALSNIKSRATSDYLRRLYASQQTREGADKIPKAPPGMKAHHLRLLGLIQPWVEGLSKEQQQEFVQWAYEEGYPLGDDPENIEMMPEMTHDKLHSWLKQNRIQVDTRNKFSGIKDMSLNERFVPFLLYMENVIQPGVDKAKEMNQDEFQTGALLRELGVKAGSRTAFNLIPGGDAALGLTTAAYDLSENDKLSATLAGFAGAAGESAVGEWAAPILWTTRDLNELSQRMRGYDTRTIQFDDDLDLDKPLSVTYNQYESLNIDPQTQRAIGLE